MSLVCEAFQCLPSEAREELETDPDRMALRILELRAYARTKAQLDAATGSHDTPTGPMADLVRLITAEVLREARARHGG